MLNLINYTTLPVTSSNIKTLHYNPKLSVLIVEFNSGSIYSYSNVENHIFNNFNNAISAGKYFNSTIKPHYNYTRLV
jgi:hypothetical protein